MKNNSANKQMTIKSKSEPVADITLETILDKVSNDDYVVVWQHDAILIGRVKDKTLEFADAGKFSFDRVQRMRIFNEERELYVWRTGYTLKGRTREDNKGDEIFTIDAKQVLIGTRKENLCNGFCKVSEDRGFELTLPDFDFEMPEGENKRIAVLTRNYIGYTQSGVAGYEDCRFVDFVTF